MQVVTTNRITGQENGLSGPLPLGVFHSVVSSCVHFQVRVKIHLAHPSIISHCYKEMRYDMGEPLGKFPLLKQYQVLHVK